MRPLLLNVAVTLDGYIEGPNGEIDWCVTDQDYGMTAFLERCDGLLMGRKSYEALLTYDANAWPDKERYVFSRTLKEMNGPGRLFGGDLVAEVQRLKQAPGKAIWLFGGADVLTQCMEVGLVDELVLSIHPLLLGGGVPLHQCIARTPLRLLDNVTYDSGLVQLTYAVVR
jgi:dihydrofolate reductase